MWFRPADRHDRRDQRSARTWRVGTAQGRLTGILVGGDAGTLIAIGGAGLGLFGLYIWQRG